MLEAPVVTDGLNLKPEPNSEELVVDVGPPKIEPGPPAVAPVDKLPKRPPVLVELSGT